MKLVVIANPDTSYLKILDTLPPSVNVVVSNQAEKLKESVPEADVILAAIASGHLLREIFPHAKQVRWLHTLSGGIEKMLFPELVASSVIMTNARGVFKLSLAEFVTGAVLYFAKDFRRLSRSQQEGQWQPFQMEDVNAKVMGIVGYGETGQACAERARALGVKVVGLRRRPELSHNDPFLDAVFGPDDLHALLAQSDYVVVAAPGTPQTKQMIGKAEIAALKSTAVFINIGRGSTVDENALVEALEQRRIRGAALDVFQTEPLPAGHPFFRLENVLLSPHCADQTFGFMELDMKFFMENMKRYLNGEPLKNIVDKQAGY